MEDESTRRIWSAGLGGVESTSWIWLGRSAVVAVTDDAIFDESAGFVWSLVAEADDRSGRVGVGVGLAEAVAGAADEGGLRRGPLALFFVV